MEWNLPKIVCSIVVTVAPLFAATPNFEYRSFLTATDMYIDYAKNKIDTEKINKNIDFYNSKLSFINNTRTDKLLYLAAEKQKDNLFLFELRFNSENNTIVSLSKKIICNSDCKISIVTTDYNKTKISISKFLALDTNIGSFILNIEDKKIGKFYDNEDTRNLIYELKVSLDKNIDADRYVYTVKDKTTSKTINKFIVPKIKQCTYFKLLSDSQPLKNYHETTSKTIQEVISTDIVRKVVREGATTQKNSWHLVSVNDTIEGWIYVDEKKYFTKYTSKCDTKDKI